MMLFLILFSLVIIQRLVELFIAKRHEKELKKKGAFEVGQAHYKWIVLLHTIFLVTLFTEVMFFSKPLSSWYMAPLTLFLLAQVGRVWAINSLGVYWNTKIIVLPGAKVVSKGPYKYIRHPNYLVVAIEILALPLVFQAYFTAIIFTLLNALVIVGVRLPDEEKALRKLTNYEDKMGANSRFIPTGKSKKI